MFSGTNFKKKEWPSNPPSKFFSVKKKKKKKLHDYSFRLTDILYIGPRAGVQSFRSRFCGGTDRFFIRDRDAVRDTAGLPTSFSSFIKFCCSVTASYSGF